MTTYELDQYVLTTVLPQIEPLFEDEMAFLGDLVDSLKRIVMGESLSDNQKYLVSTEKPFKSGGDGGSEGEGVTLEEIQMQINQSGSDEQISPRGGNDVEV